MFATLATIVSGEADWADVFFLVALIVAAIASVVPAVGKVALLPVSVAFVAAGFLML